MGKAVDVRLGGPQFLMALVIARAKWEETRDCVEPPMLQPSYNFVMSNCKMRSASARKQRIRDVIASVRLMTGIAARTGLQWPACLFLDWGPPVDVSRRPMWIKALASMPDSECVRLLSQNVHKVGSKTAADVEDHFNKAARMLRSQSNSMPCLEQHQLAAVLVSCCNSFTTQTSEMSEAVTHTDIATAMTTTTRARTHTFYYIAAGIGSGIADMEQQGFKCVGACEIDSYCREVLARHHPHVPLHDDVKTLDLKAACSSDQPLTLVVLSTPCVDVSARGQLLAQDGEESNLFFTALKKVQDYYRDTGVLPTLVSENVQGRRHRTTGPDGKWRQPFLRTELDAVVRAGYREVGWREVCTADFGVPNPKNHIVLVAHSGPGTLGITGCSDCGMCATCTGGINCDDAGAALAWDLGEIYGLAEPCMLPAPTTTSLARTVVCYVHSRTWAQLDIRDAERAQGLQPDHTWLPEDSPARAVLTAAQLRAKRFRCVGNALHGGVRTDL